ncbi:16S rRNA processing protein RimM [Weissella uvarum]|uniref:ribosome maturation factor RimM n=1 Tax=Weissella uvarum TaxID=1479233 RepID=UPI001961EEDD|nr:ribosome maturation factor RimM [Weissella uvarum]MBM7617749.1 16S rRNA processing protein RimM [Weissella uvarum]MCM0595872.1 ribosome maturation factor RimM [Weissella uvarum]
MSLFKVGSIVNTHGIRGEVRVVPITDFPEERFQVGEQLVIDGKQPLTVEIATARPHKQFYLLSFKDMQDINLVEQYKGRDLMVDETQIEALADEDAYYYHDIIGLEVIDQATGDHLGKVSEILELPANDVWVVKRPSTEDLLLPNIKQVVEKVDLENGQVFVNQLEEI